MKKFEYLLNKNQSLTITLKSGTKFKIEKNSYKLVNDSGIVVNFPRNNNAIANLKYIKITTSSGKHTIDVEDIEIVEEPIST